MDHAFTASMNEVVESDGFGSESCFCFLMSYVILGKFLHLSEPQFLYLSSFVRCLTQHLEGAKQIIGANYYTTLLVEDSKSQAKEMVKAIVRRERNKFHKERSKVSVYGFGGLVASMIPVSWYSCPCVILPP